MRIIHPHSARTIKHPKPTTQLRTHARNASKTSANLREATIAHESPRARRCHSTKLLEKKWLRMSMSMSVYQVVNVCVCHCINVCQYASMCVNVSPCVPMCVNVSVSQFVNVCVCVFQCAWGGQWPYNRRVTEGTRGAGRAVKRAKMKASRRAGAPQRPMRGDVRARAHGGACQPPSMPQLSISWSCRLISRQKLLKPCNFSAPALATTNVISESFCVSVCKSSSGSPTARAARGKGSSAHTAADGETAEGEGASRRRCPRTAATRAPSRCDSPARATRPIAHRARGNPPPTPPPNGSM